MRAPLRGRASRWIAASVGLALLLAACNQPSPARDPDGALRQALRTMADDPGQRVTLRLDSDAASLTALTEGELEQEQIATILASSLTLSLPADGDTDRGETVVTIDGKAAVEIRTVDADTVYVRADLPVLVTAFGGKPAQLASAEREAARSGLQKDAVARFFGGDWIAVTGLERFNAQMTQEMAEFEDELARGRTKSRTRRTPDAGEVTKRLADVGRTLLGAADVSYVGESDAGSQLLATVPLRDAAAGLFDLAAAVSGSGLPGFPAFPTALPPQARRQMLREVPQGNMGLDLFLRGGRLVEARADLLQLMELDEVAQPLPDGVERLGLAFGFAPFDGAVDVPDGAVRVPVRELFGGMAPVPFAGGGSTRGRAELAPPDARIVAPPAHGLKAVPRSELRRLCQAGPPPPDMPGAKKFAEEIAAACEDGQP